MNLAIIGNDLYELAETLKQTIKDFEAYVASHQASSASAASAAITPIAASTAPSSETPSLEDLKQVALKIADKSRQRLVDELTKLGVSKISEIPEGERASAYAQLLKATK